MADLEDTILKQNIPGRWSTHDRGMPSDVRHECDEGDCDDEHHAAITDEPPKSEEEQLMSLAKNLAYDDVPEPIRQSIIAQRLRNPSTGVKVFDFKNNYMALCLSQLSTGCTCRLPSRPGTS